MTNNIPTVAIVGRTNVGKSTLFNALCGRRLAIVEDLPGVTRDRHYALISRSRVPFSLIDTGGIVGDYQSNEETIKHIQQQAKMAMDEAHIILAVFDGIAGIHPLDQELIQKLRKIGKPVLVVVNKCEKESTEHEAHDFMKMGLGDVFAVSAAHRKGMKELVEGITVELEAQGYKEGMGVDALPDTNQIKIAVIGRPNVGKSSLINRFLGEDRMLVSSEAGTTKDAIDSIVKRDGQEYLFIDTAGLRKKAKIDHATIERYSTLRSLRSLARADIAVLVLDATDGVFGDQDKTLASLIHERGRGLIIAVNKWDLVEKDHRTAKEFRDAIHEAMPYVKYAPIHFISALSGRHCPSIVDRVNEVYKNWTYRIKTSDLNKMFIKALKRNPPPVVRGSPVKLFFATQSETSPPEIVLFFNHPKDLPQSYERYLKQQVREEFPLIGTDVKLILRKRTDKQHIKREDEDQKELADEPAIPKAPRKRRKFKRIGSAPAKSHPNTVR